MEQNESENVFKLFWCSKNLASQTLNSNGNGIGLFICKQICQRLGGNIKVSSDVGVGTMFTFTMNAFLTDRKGSSAASI